MQESQDAKIEEHIRGVINSPELSEEQKAVMAAFDAAKKANGVSPHGRRTYIYFLRELALFVKKPFEECTRDDIAKYVNYKSKGNTHSLNGGKGRSVEINSEVTAFKARVHCKLFFKWLNNGTYPDCVSWLERRKPNISKQPEDMLSWEELKQIYDGCADWNHAAMLRILYETGTRPSEFRGIRISDIELEDQFAKIRIMGKGKRERRVFVVSEFPVLMQVLKQHPKRDDPAAPLFYVPRQKNIRPYSQRGLDQIIKRAAKRAGVTKRVYTHVFRFSRATELAQKMSESEMRIFFGWTKNSTMPQHYVNLSQKHVENKYLEINGK